MFILDLPFADPFLKHLRYESNAVLAPSCRAELRVVQNESDQKVGYPEGSLGIDS